MATDNKKSDKKLASLDFETAYNRLTETANQLEAGKLSLEESLALYEEGVALARHCESLLDKAELRVKQLAPDYTPSASISASSAPKVRRTLFDEEDEF